MEIRNFEGIKNVAIQSADNNNKAESVEHDNKYAGEFVTVKTLAMDPRATIAMSAIKRSEKTITDEVAKEQIQEALKNVDEDLGDNCFESDIKSAKQDLISHTTKENFDLVNSCINNYKKNLSNLENSEKDIYSLCFWENLLDLADEIKLNKYNKEISLALYKNPDLIRSNSNLYEIINEIDNEEKKQFFEDFILNQPTRLVFENNTLLIEKTPDGYNSTICSNNNLMEIDNYKYNGTPEQKIFRDKFYSSRKNYTDSLLKTMTKLNKYNKNILARLLAENVSIDQCNFVNYIQDDITAKLAETFLAKNSDNKYCYSELSDFLKSLDRIRGDLSRYSKLDSKTTEIIMTQFMDSIVDKMS